MANQVVTIQAPMTVYDDLQELASAQGIDAVGLLKSLLGVERQRLELQKNWRELKKEVMSNGHTPTSKEAQMSVKTIHMQLPEDVYFELIAIAEVDKLDPIEQIRAWIKQTCQQEKWRKGWRELRDEVQRTGNFDPNESIDDLVERLRKQREEIFETEYAHLYR